MSDQKDKCPECKGRRYIGCIFHLAGDFGGINDELSTKCPTCNGTGEKKLDSPREKIIDIICPFANRCVTRNQYGCFTERESWSLCVSADRTNKMIALIEPLIKDAYKEGYEKAQANLNSPEIIAIVDEALKEAKKQEREGIKIELSGFAEMLKRAPEMHGDIQSDPLKTQEFLIWWQALKEE